jgi:outer membrane lipoprotein LolB
MVLMLFLLAGCAARPIPDSDGSAATAYTARFSELSAWQSWNLTARLGIDDGTEGGSGRLDWQVNGSQETLQFRGALGQGAWRIDIDEDRARLQRADGSVTTAPRVQDLVLQ